MDSDKLLLDQDVKYAISKRLLPELNYERERKFYYDVCKGLGAVILSVGILTTPTQTLKSKVEKTRQYFNEVCDKLNYISFFE